MNKIGKIITTAGLIAALVVVPTIFSGCKTVKVNIDKITKEPIIEEISLYDSYTPYGKTLSHALAKENSDVPLDVYVKEFEKINKGKYMLPGGNIVAGQTYFYPDLNDDGSAGFVDPVITEYKILKKGFDFSDIYKKN